MKERTTGRWVDIFYNLGVDIGDGQHKSCPVCGGKDRFRFDDNEGKGTWICNQCGAGNGFELVMRILNVDFKGACKAIEKIIGKCEVNSIPKEKTAPDFKEIFKSLKKVSPGDPVQKYLQGRGLKSMPKTLWYGKLWESETRKDQHCMVAIFRAPDNTAITIHRTFITEDGKKLDIKSPKKIMTPLRKMSGGCVQLYGYKKGILGVTEGIETGIAVHDAFNIPVWVALSSTLMSGCVLPVNVENVAIYCDNDLNYAGQKAAYTLANRLMIDGKAKTAEVFVPAIPGTDWLDEISKG